MDRRSKYNFIVKYFSATQPITASELHYTSAYELLVATILAAQCTDKRVNMVTPALFAKYPTAAELAKAELDEIHSFVKSVSYPNNKAKHLSEMAKKVVADFGGEIPDTMEGLTSLPGVGRKTANVVLAFAFGKAAMPVDTHVFRVSHRIGLVGDTEKTPEAVEKVLSSNFPQKHLSNAHHWLLLHGRYVCTARTPRCEDCALQGICSHHKIRNKTSK